MKPVRWTSHALERIGRRLIEQQLAKEMLTEPEFTLPGQRQRDLHLRRYSDPALGREMLLVLVVEETPSETVVVSAYKTSRIVRYLWRLQQ